MAPQTSHHHSLKNFHAEEFLYLDSIDWVQMGCLNGKEIHLYSGAVVAALPLAQIESSAPSRLTMMIKIVTA
jgi:hypothetical protein